MDRHKLYQHFGPHLIEAIMLIIRDEINILRVNNGLSERTIQQMVDAVEKKYIALPKYDWEDDEG